MNAAATHPRTAREFPVVTDPASYYIPTVGIAFLSMTAGFFVAIVVGTVAASRGFEPVTDVPFIAWMAVTGVGGAAWWVRRRWRIHHERKLIVDGVGITYVKFAGRSRLIRWSDMREIIEEEEWELGHWLTIKHRWGHFKIESHAFHGYDEIRELARVFLPGRTHLRPR